MTSLSSLSQLQTRLAEAEKTLSQSIWPQLEAVEYTCFQRVLEAFIRHRVGEEHFAAVTGYGHDDLGREVTDKVFADALQAEAALVRVQMVSGTHALSVALNGALHHGDTMLSLTGRPYDTLEEVIGLRANNPQSLQNKGVQYQEIDVLGAGQFDLTFSPEAEVRIRQATVGYIQRSRGYSIRPALRIDQIKALIEAVRTLNPDITILVDNCYGEFTEAQEPTAVGADLMAGSLIKNPGGGIVPAGGYVAGRKDLVASCAAVLTCPGVGAKGGYTFDLTRLLLQGLFLAPSTVKEALKGMTLSALLFEQLGFSVTPSWQEGRSDIIQVLHLQSPERLVAFCQTVQRVSPINSAVTPVPSEVPGYGDEIVMAGGTFIEGSTIELSADGPLREPYTAFLQGGLTYAHTRYALQQILENPLFKI